MRHPGTGYLFSPDIYLLRVQVPPTASFTISFLTMASESAYHHVDLEAQQGVSRATRTSDTPLYQRPCPNGS